MVRVITIWISNNFRNQDVLCDLYTRFKNDIPKEFAKMCEYSGGNNNLQLALKPDSPEFHQAIEIIKSKNLRHELFSEVFYTKGEIENSSYFELYIMKDVLELEGTYLTHYGTKYEGRCEQCGFSGTLTGDALIDRKFMHKAKIGIASPEYFVCKELKDAIEDSGLTGVKFEHEIKDYKGRDMPKYYVISFQNALPPLSSSTLLEPSSPDKCGHSTLYLRSDLQYEKEKLADARDFNITAECLNNNKMPKIVISAKARKFLQANRIFCRYIPVALL